MTTLYSPAQLGRSYVAQVKGYDNDELKDRALDAAREHFQNWDMKLGVAQTYTVSETGRPRWMGPTHEATITVYEILAEG